MAKVAPCDLSAGTKKRRDQPNKETQHKALAKLNHRNQETGPCHPGTVHIRLLDISMASDM